MSILHLDLKGTNSDNSKVITPELIIPTTNLLQLMTFPSGVFHDSPVIKYNDTPLTENVDYILVYRCLSLYSKYNIIAYGGIVILNKTISGSISIALKYLGGVYQHYEGTSIPNTILNTNAYTLGYWEDTIDIPEQYSSVAGVFNAISSGIRVMLDTTVELTPEINDRKPISTMDLIFTDYLDNVWLKSGIWIHNVDKYPSAETFTINSIAPVSFSTDNQFGIAEGICWDGVNFWIVSSSSKRVFKYSSTGIYLDISFPVTTDTNPTGICWDGNNFWICGNQLNRAYKYKADGSSTGIYISADTQDSNIQGIIYIDGIFGILGSTTRALYKYDMDGNYIGLWAKRSIYYPVGICWDGNYIWITTGNSNEVYRFNADGTYIDTPISMGDIDGNITGITWDGDFLRIAGNITKEVYTISRNGSIPTEDQRSIIKTVVGIENEIIDEHSNLPIYLRVK